MKHRLEMYLENNKRLMWTQFNKQLAEQVSNHFNECHETLSIFMNLVRAFDIVAHHIILRMHDIRGCKRYYLNHTLVIKNINPDILNS